MRALSSDDIRDFILLFLRNIRVWVRREGIPAVGNLHHMVLAGRQGRLAKDQRADMRIPIAKISRYETRV